MNIAKELYDIIKGIVIFAAKAGIVLPKGAGWAIKVDPTAPSYTWEDVKGLRIVDALGVSAPTLEAYKTGATSLAYGAGDKQSWEFHVTHEDITGGDKFVHIHTRHNGTGITGNLVIDLVICYNFGFNRAGSPAPITKTITVTPAQLPQYQTNIQDILFAQTGGGAGLLNSSDFLVDDDILITITVTTLPSITGGTTNKIFIPYCDIHREVTNIGTKSRAPDFYV